MKKTALVVVLAVALVLVFAATAMARPNGNIYIKWDTANGDNNIVPTPHAGYTTATEKCNVCHSVHYAATSGFAWPDGTNGPNAWTADSSDTQMLLRSSVANACNYCHIQTAVGGVQLYGGVVSNYTDNTRFNHSGPAAACSGCHSVHGAGTFQGANKEKILRVLTATTMQPEVIGVANANGSPNASITVLFPDGNANGTGADEAIASTDKYLQQVAFCSQCHAEYTSASEHTITGGPGYDNGGFIPGSEYKGHPMKTAEGSFVAAGDNFAGQAAWKDSSTCRSCHDAGNVNQTGVTWNSFPHYTQGYFVFSFTGDASGTVDPADNDKDYATDGNCLKCHVNQGKTAGVNITF